MPNSARWTDWIAMVHASDASLVQLATMAAAALLIWESIGRAPLRVREPLRSGYLLGLLLLFLYFFGGGGGTLDTAAYTWAVGVVMFAVGGALAVWRIRRKVKEAMA